jgi:RNA polymerase sigma-70 factor (ECF subfamily)
METRETIEQRIREAHERGEHERAATLAVETYGREVLSFLIARLGETHGNDVFSEFMEDFWRGLPAFGWRSSLRTWVYTLARHASVRHVRGPHHKRAQVATSAESSTLADRVRTQTAAYLRTEVKDRFRDLRAQLPDDDQTLLVLRVDRGMAWRDLALVMAEPGAELADAALDTEAARLRTQFKRAKERLRALAEAEGLLPAQDEET